MGAAIFLIIIGAIMLCVGITAVAKNYRYIETVIDEENILPIAIVLLGVAQIAIAIIILVKL